MPPSHSSRYIRAPETNLAHSELDKLATSLGPGLGWLSDDVLEFLKKNKRLYTDKQALEEIRHSGKVFVHDESTLIDVQDFIALSSFLGAAEKLMRTTLYKTRIAPQPEKQVATTGEECATEAETVSASLASDTAVDTETDSGDETVTPNTPSKPHIHSRHKKRSKTSHTHAPQDMVENVMQETKMLTPKSTHSHSTPTKKVPKFYAGKLRSNPLGRWNTLPHAPRADTILTSVSLPLPILLWGPEDHVTKDENVFFTSPPADKPPAKKLKLEATVLIDDHAGREISDKKPHPVRKVTRSVPEGTLSARRLRRSASLGRLGRDRL